MSYIVNVNEIKENVSIDTILKHFTDWEGGKQKLLCPFHHEKTPSFSVASKKNIGTCFGGCGRSWKPIDFIMEHQGIPFIEAIELAAKLEGIPIQYAQNLSESQLKEAKQSLEKRQTAFYYNSTLIERYFNHNYKDILQDSSIVNQPIKLGKRSLNWETIQLFTIAQTPQKWTFTTDFIQSHKMDASLCSELGWTKTNDKGTFDVYQNRLLFPIREKNGSIAGITARALNDDAKAKYINSPESIVYKKDQLLYGLHENQEGLRMSKTALVVEGPFDVVTLHDTGIKNAVATCGTTLSKHQIGLLKSLVNEIVLIYDGDQAGIKAVQKHIPMLLKSGMMINIVILPEGQDPDSFVREKDATAFEDYVKKHKTEALTWSLDQIIKDKNNVYQVEDGIDRACELLCCLESESLRVSLANNICKKYSIGKTVLKKRIKEALSKDEEGNSELSEEQQSDLLQYGFYEDHNCYHNSNTQLSNYVIKPLFHINSQNDPKRLFTLVNIWGESKIMDIDTADFTSLDRFVTKAESVGNYVFKGNSKDFLKIKSKVYDQMDSCNEIEMLGHHEDGFYAFSNGLYADGQFYEIDDAGVVQFRHVNYFLPALSMIYKKYPQHFIDEKRFIYKPCKVDFSTWAKLFCQVHGDNGKIALCYYIASLFRDLIYKEFKFFPHLNFFGQPGTGKSYLAWSLSHMFGEAIPPFNLNSGTQVGFFNRFEVAKNNLVWFDEYKNSIDFRRVEFLKGAYDGVGREKGQKSSKRSIKTLIYSACLISGQELPTADNALFTRVITLEFSKANRTQKEKEKGRKLEELQETATLGAITTQLLDYRDIIKQNFSNTFDKISQQLRKELKNNKFVKDRILSNMVILLSVFSILEEYLNFPFTKESFMELAKKAIIHQSELISSADEVSTFWDTVDFMAANLEITLNTDYLIEELDSVRIIKEGKNTVRKQLGETKRVLFLSLTKAHPLYMEAHKRRFNKLGLPKSSLLHYLKHHPSFIGSVKSKRIGDSNTSCFAFDYDMLELNILSTEEDPAQVEEDIFKEMER